jgi:hypothetical protein
MCMQQAALKKCIELSSEPNSQAHFLLANLYMQKSQYKEAAEHYAKVHTQRVWGLLASHLSGLSRRCRGCLSVLTSPWPATADLALTPHLPATTITTVPAAAAGRHHVLLGPVVGAGSRGVLQLRHCVGQA